MSDRFVVHCSTCGYLDDEILFQTVASEEARTHRARTSRPGQPAHNVIAMRYDVWMRGERDLQALQSAALTAARPALVVAAQVGPYGNFQSLYKTLGLRLTPILPPCASCRANPPLAYRCTACRGGKKPMLARWQEGGALVEGANVGIVCGEGFASADTDHPKVTEALLQREVAKIGNETITTISCRGYHVGMRADGLPSSKPRLCGACLRHEDLHPILGCKRAVEVFTFDMKGEGGYVVAPPSIHATGFQYRFLAGDALANRRLARIDDLLPDHLVELLYHPLGKTLTGNTNTNSNTAAGRGAEPAGADPTQKAVPPPLPDVSPEEWARVEAWAAEQHGLFRDHWLILTGRATTLNRSKSDWVLALGLSQARFDQDLIRRVLLNLPGSKAHALWFAEGPERADAYTRLTIGKAWNIKQESRRATA